MTWYVRIENNKIVINDLTSLKTVHYNLSDIAAITHSEKYMNRKGIEKGIEHYMIIFNDGYTYSSHIYGFFSIQSDRIKLKEQFEELSHKTGIAIQTIRQDFVRSINLQHSKKAERPFQRSLSSMQSPSRNS